MTMTNSKRTRKARTLDVVTQISIAFRNPSAAALGALMGGIVPWFGRELAHDEIPAAWSAGNTVLAYAMVAVVLGCCLFSCVSVYKLGKIAFADSRKAIGFVLALEGVMVISRGTTSTVALATLILINAIANGCVIATAREATVKRKADDARRSATRARNRAAKQAAAAGVSVPAPVKATEHPALFS